MLAMSHNLVSHWRNMDKMPKFEKIKQSPGNGEIDPFRNDKITYRSHRSKDFARHFRNKMRDTDFPVDALPEKFVKFAINSGNRSPTILKMDDYVRIAGMFREIGMRGSDKQLVINAMDLPLYTQKLYKKDSGRFFIDKFFGSKTLVFQYMNSDGKQGGIASVFLHMHPYRQDVYIDKDSHVLGHVVMVGRISLEKSMVLYSGQLINIAALDSVLINPYGKDSQVKSSLVSNSTVDGASVIWCELDDSEVSGKLHSVKLRNNEFVEKVEKKDGGMLADFLAKKNNSMQTSQALRFSLSPRA